MIIYHIKQGEDLHLLIIIIQLIIQKKKQEEEDIALKIIDERKSLGENDT